MGHLTTSDDIMNYCNQTNQPIQDLTQVSSPVAQASSSSQYLLASSPLARTHSPRLSSGILSCLDNGLFVIRLKPTISICARSNYWLVLGDQYRADIPKQLLSPLASGISNS